MSLIQDTHVPVGEFLLSEGPSQRSREMAIVTVAGGVALPSGTVLGKVGASSANPVATATAGNTGNGTVGTITPGDGIRPGTYKLRFIEPSANGGTYTVEGPDGIEVGRGNVAVAFNAGGLAFTVADGATDFVAGDGFNIVVLPGLGKYVKWAADADLGADIASAVLLTPVPGENGDHRVTIFARDSEVIRAALNNYAGVTDAVVAQLAQYGILCRG